jgi:hypothetical protein
MGGTLSPLAAVFNLNHPAHIVNWNFIHVPISNVIVVILMFIVFFAAILLPFPGAQARREHRS